MLTRCHKRKRFYSPLLFAALILVSQNSSAQFNKYRSQTDFNGTPGSVPATPPPPSEAAPAVGADDISSEDAAAALKAAEDLQARADATEAAESEEAESDSAFEDEEADEANEGAFGSRVSPSASSSSSKKDGKYVNLNPETGFGPEIVESFDFPETDIMEITKHMQKLTGINLILDKDVKGKVSIIAPTPITVGDAWKAYLAALNMAGYSLVKTGAFYKVISARDIRYTPTKIYTGSYTPDTENYVMKVIALKYVSAAEIARNFRPFMTRYGRIIDIKQTNTVIIADTGSNINRLAKMVKFLDVAGHEESLQIVKVKNSSAQEIAKLLDNILKGGSGGAARAGQASPRFAGSGGGSEGTGSSISRIIAEPRTNSIIAMANSEGAAQLKELINKLDVRLISSSSNRVHVYYLNYGDSEELSKTLQAIVSGAASKDSAGAASRFTATMGGSSDNAIFSAEVKITSDKNNNALVVTASPTDWLTLKDVIGRLDIPRDQVYVEGMILEANVSNTKGFGVEWAGAYGQGNIQRAGLINTQSNLLGLLQSGIPQSIGGFFAGAGIGPTRTITDSASGKSIKVNAVNAFVKAIASHGNTNILATPQILALDNTEATFEVGDTTPVRNSTVTGTGIQNNSFTSQEAKLSLKITPQINKVTRFVKLKINQKIDDFKATTGVAEGSALPTTTRSAITEVMVRDRDTIAMGGLLRDKENISSNKIPLLGDIPVLGWLFKNKTRTIEKVNLLFFMTPKILAPYTKTASANTKELIQRRTKFMKNVFNEDDHDPNTELSAGLEKKLDQQAQGPLYDAEDANHYKNLNDEQTQPERPDESTQLDTPDYIGISKTVKQ